MGAGFLIDSNAVIDYLDGKLPESGKVFLNGIVDNKIIVSVITKIEVLGFNSNSVSGRLIHDFIDSAIVFNLDDDIINMTIELRKKHRFKLPDSIIAATAVVNKLVLVTRNVSDFQNIKGLKAIDPWKL